MAVTQEPILSRLDRLDNLMRHLEEMKIRSNRGRSSSLTPSTPSSGTGTPTSEGRASFLDFSHRSRDQFKHPCRPIDDVIVETEHKGTLLDRVERMEDRLFTGGPAVFAATRRDGIREAGIERGRQDSPRPQP